jgi:hypothetical protein
MAILVNGCSHTQGFELEQEIGFKLNQPLTGNEYKLVEEYRKNNSWTSVFGKYFNEIIINKSSQGKGNEDIILEIFDYIEEFKDVSLVLIGLSSPTRFTKTFNNLGKKEQQYFTLAHLGDHIKDLFANTGDETMLLSWYESERKYFFTEEDVNIKLLKLIKALISYLKAKKINYFLTNTFDPAIQLQKITEQFYEDSLEKLGLDHQYKRGEGHHWLSEAHLDFGNRALTKYLKIN